VRDVRIYRITCKLCNRVIESDNFELAKKNMRHHILSHDQIKAIAEALIQTYATIETYEVEEVVIT
jgi:adenine-specific DNA methylase